MREYAKRNNFLQGQVFNMSGQILELEQIALDDIVLTPQQSSAIDLHILGFARQCEKLHSIGGRRQRGVLLEGEPGCGKSMVLRAIAPLVAGMSVCLVSPTEICGRGGVDDLQHLLEMAAPCAVFIEELDVFGQDRSLQNSPQLGDLLQLMDGLRTVPAVLWVATTNRPKEVEAALIDRPGRFDRRIKFGPLNPEHRARLIKLFIRPGRLTPNAFELLLESTNGQTGAHVREMCETLRLMALIRGLDSAECDRDLVADAIADCGFDQSRLGFASGTRTACAR